jgi:nitric oxide reductase NorE protein
MTANAIRPLSDPPGGVLLWIVVTLELVTFGMVFFLLAMFRANSPEVFQEGQRLLDPRFGLVLTLTLLTSGWLVAEAVHAYRGEQLVRARRFYAAGIAVGLGFVVLKVYDFAVKTGAGMSLSDDFGAAYLLSSAFHLAHVLVGLGMLASVALRVGREPFEDDETAIAGTALFWHMCDIAWLFLFPLLLLGG